MKDFYNPGRTLPSVDNAALSEEQFYSFYTWCLNPMLSLRDLFERLGEELERYEGLQVGWQPEECRVNLYLFICAIACTVDDYLAWRPWNLSLISDHFPRLRFAVAPIRWLLNMPHGLLTLFCDRPIVLWRRTWDHCVDQVCGILAGGSEPGVREWADLKMRLQALVNAKLPGRLLKWRMRLPEGFRCQDLTHQDVFSMVGRFLVSQPDGQGRLVVIGPRTAGAYFAPLAKAYLLARGWSLVSWITIRPKKGLSRWEKRRLRTLLCRGARVLFIDDHPNTGQTFRLMLRVLERLGVPPERITILAPGHPARPDWTLPEAAAQGVTIITLAPEEFHKARLLAPGPVEFLLREYYGNHGWEEVRLQENGQVDLINGRLWQHYPDDFHVRLKRVFEVQLSRNNQEPVLQRIFVKSVGWGWLGYHAYIAGTRLAGFVPPVIGLRNGLLFTEWLEEAKQSQETSVNDNLLHTLSSYVAQRAQRLRLIEDPCFTNSDDGTGWTELINTFRGAYGPYVNRLKVPALRRQLRRYVSPLPTLVDGQMKSDEWIETKTGPYKVDFEHHNFGGEELNVVDPAYDLASAIFEFRLSEPAEQKLLQGYVRESGDRTISDRILLYKLLYGIRAMKRAANRVVRKSSNQKQEQWNRRYLLARDFLIAQTSRLCSSLITKQERARWTKSLFFLDLDGVFDHEIFGFLNFPHTTSSGLAALALLQSHGFSIVLNTGRSVEHVRNYCQTYALPGGLAEYGSVFVDAVQQRELALIEAGAAEQLVRCREAIIKIPGVFIDPGYQYSVRAYRYNGQRTAGLGVAEVENLLTRLQCDRLTFIARSEDTYIVQKGTGKGPGLLVAKRYLGCTNEPVIAMGDSEQDLTMLEEAEFSYAPANCSKRIREIASKSRCRIMAQPFQRGLLAAVLDVLGNGPTAYHGNTIKPDHAKDSSDLLPLLLQVAERPRLRQFLAVLNWRGL